MLTGNIVLIIRVAERKIDKLIDTALLDYSPNAAELDSVQFESEWTSIFRSPFSKKKPAAQSNGTSTVTSSSTSASIRSTHTESPGSSRPTSPTPQQGAFAPSTPKGFSSLKSSFNKARAHSASVSSLQSFFLEPPQSQSPQELIAFLSAFHTLLTDSGINPAVITQLWSQVMYWTSCERARSHVISPINNGRRRSFQ